MYWQHPDGWPKPITLWQLGFYLNSTVLELEGIDSCDLAAHDWVDVVVTIRSSGTPIKIILGAIVSRSATPHIIGVAGPYSLLSDLVAGEQRSDVQRIVGHECGRSVIVVQLELPVTSTSQRDVMTPGVHIERGKVVFEDKLAGADCQQNDE